MSTKLISHDNKVIHFTNNDMTLKEAIDFFYSYDPDNYDDLLNDNAKYSIGQCVSGYAIDINF